MIGSCRIVKSRSGAQTQRAKRLTARFYLLDMRDATPPPATQTRKRVRHVTTISSTADERRHPTMRRDSDSPRARRSPLVTASGVPQRETRKEHCGMDFDDAIKAHELWKMKLACYVARPDESLDPATVADDGLCELGRWIRERRPTHAHVPAFVVLDDCHAKFHEAAAEIVARADAGEDVTEEIAIGARSDYAWLSAEVTHILVVMKRRLAA
jgi:hypothetical protein